MNHLLFLYCTKIILIAFLSLILLLVNSKECKVLSIEGGGTEGAFEAGALNAFSEFLKLDDLEYDIITGVSVGTLTGGALSFSSNSNLTRTINLISNLWLNITDNQIFTNWKDWGIINGILFKPGIFDNSPEKSLVNTILHQVGDKLHRNFTIGITDAQQGIYFTESDPVITNALHFITGSSAMPGAFPPEQIDQFLGIDGGTTYNLDLFSPIHFCKSNGYQENQIIIDALLTDSLKIQVINSTNFTSMWMYNRAKSIMKIHKKYFFLNETMEIHPNIIWRYLIIPSKQIPLMILNFIPLDTNPIHLKEAFDMGYNESKKQIFKAKSIPIRY